MNGLNLRISNGRNNTVRNTSFGVAAVEFSADFQNSFGDTSPSFKQFLCSVTADEQLVKLKDILNNDKQYADGEISTFLVKIYLQAPAKHPVKCFITRYITKTKSLQQPFSSTLSSQLVALMSAVPADYRLYVDVLMVLSTCIENFPTGADAVRSVEVTTAEYLKNCLSCCITTLRENSTSLSPTEKNEVFTMSHLTLRLLLYMVQKISAENSSSLISHLEDIRSNITWLMFDHDVPMDTRSVCGILYLSLYVLENGEDAWVDILATNPPEVFKKLLENEVAELPLYSAIVTIVSVDNLQSQYIDGEFAFSVLTDRILTIGEKSCSDATNTLCVARTVLQLAKSLPRLHHPQLAHATVDSILVYIWSHLEHYMDSVRHLTGQALGCVVKYCNQLNKAGDDTALTNLFAALTSLDRHRKSYLISVTLLGSELGARSLFQQIDNVVDDTVAALSLQPVQASAATALEALLQKHTEEADLPALYCVWVLPILSHVAACTLDSGVLNILENLLAKLVKSNEGITKFILPHIKTPLYTTPACNIPTSTYDGDLKCILMLLSVVRKSGVADKMAAKKKENDSQGNEWKGLISYDVLKVAAVHPDDETRVLTLSLIVESHKSTEMLTLHDMQFVLYYLKYNINAQSPNFRQNTLGLMKKLVKRLEDSYKVLKRQYNPSGDYQVAPPTYADLIEDLRKFCFDSLVEGANYSRRYVALQVLAWCEQTTFEDHERHWEAQYVQKLLHLLDDSYENNKKLALEIFDGCPEDLLSRAGIELSAMLSQASSVKPTDCTGAAYKLVLVRRKLPQLVLQGRQSDIPDAATYHLLAILLSKLKQELQVAEHSILQAAAQGPMYGTLHCMCYVLKETDASAISPSTAWRCLIDDIIGTCVRVTSSSTPVVNNSSPEGHLPMDREQLRELTPGGVKLVNGAQVTAQMVLLCAWRSVKEVSLLLGEISSRLTIEGESPEPGTLTHVHLASIGEQMTSLLAETKHRGAFEQAYVGFTKLLHRLWRCRSSPLHSLPSSWLSQLMSLISSGDSRVLCATRRSAGVPFMIQALVTTELQVNGNPKCFHQCMTTLLQLAQFNMTSTAQEIETRTHCLNILRALFRNTTLGETAAGYVGDGLLTAIRGFDATTWPERNSSTLLFSALMVRIFGVQRSRDADRLCTRNKMTGRIFFLRYPALYDFMLNKLKEVSASSDTSLLRPSLYPILVLLARLYPSSLEGTVSNLKEHILQLTAYIPHVAACARSSVLKTRQLAAKAIQPLIAPERFTAHARDMFTLLADTAVPRNHCHGILLQLIRLLDGKPESLTLDQQSVTKLSQCIQDTFWILEQAAESKPCFVLADEYVKVINLIIYKFPVLLNEITLQKLEKALHKLILDDKIALINSGRDVCLSNALYLYLIILTKIERDDISELIIKSLLHTSYEVVLATLNYLLILYGKSDEENQCKLQEHLQDIAVETIVLTGLRNDASYLQNLCHVLRSNKYLECVQKTLRVLSLEKDTQRMIIGDLSISDDDVISKLISCIENEHENLTHIYLESLSNFVTGKLSSESNVHFSKSNVLKVVNVVYSCCTSVNNDTIREVAVQFLERNGQVLLDMTSQQITQEEFHFRATVYATIAMLLEDDNVAFRQRMSDVITKSTQSLVNKVHSPRCLPSRGKELLLEIIRDQEDEKVRDMLFVVLGLLDFKSAVCLTDDDNDECRVFDQNEKYNIFMEETSWIEPAFEVLSTNGDILCDPAHVYRETVDKLCGHNLKQFEQYYNWKLSSQDTACNFDVFHPKIGLLVNRIVERQFNV